MKYVLLALLTLALLPNPASAELPPWATYTATFESTWSATTHPQDFPNNPHYSGLIGGAHNGSVSFWALGDLSTTGMKQMAEWGSKTVLEQEVEAAIIAGTASEVISGGGIGISPGTVAVTFNVSPDHPLATIVTMVAPSPDWFSGVSGLDLRASFDQHFGHNAVARRQQGMLHLHGFKHRQPVAGNHCLPCFGVDRLDQPRHRGLDQVAIAMGTGVLLQRVAQLEAIAIAPEHRDL